MPEKYGCACDPQEVNKWRAEKIIALQARVAELEAERDAWQERAAMSVRGRKAAESLLSEAVKAGMVEAVNWDAYALIDSIQNDPETVARIVASLKEGRG